MCILFLYVSDNPAVDSYKVIVAVNRDEFYKRPTQLASFWKSEPNILGARDNEPGREGGTWLAISETGRIGALLNVLQTKHGMLTSQKKGRGFLVNDFLLNSSVSAMEYLSTIHNISNEFNPFSLLTVDVLASDIPEVCYYSCSSNREPQRLQPGKVHGIGNSFLDTPFQKVKSGKEAFESVLGEYNYVDSKTALVNGILDVLKNQDKFHPDPQICKQAPDHTETFLQGISSRFIKLSGYGTRTHTIILIDFNDNVFYQELTLREPIDENNPHWVSSEYDFSIGRNKTSNL